MSCSTMPPVIATTKTIDASLLLANMHNTIAYVLTAHPNYITAPLASVEQ